jgi:hypothetical protein
MTNAIRQAHIRAAKSNPAYAVYEAYSQAVDETHGRPVAGQFELMDTAYGRLRWLDVDEASRTLGGAVGDGIATLLADWETTPAAIRDSSGTWYTVTTGLGMDTLGVGTKLSVKRWKGDAPVVSNAE